jgi:hypothetical protein
MRALVHLILSCLLLAALAPAAYAHDRNPSDRERGKHSRNHDRHDRNDRRGGQRSFLGAQADTDCSREARTCDYTFSRSVSSELGERLSWLLTEKLDAVHSFAERICDRAQKENECAGSFVAGLWNGLDALEIAVAESSCATVRLGWNKTEGLSQQWGTTNGDSCTD